MSAPSPRPRVALAWIGCLSLALALSAILTIGAAASSAAPSISISGNHFVDGTGNPVRLLGVNRTSPEYACTYGEIGTGPQPGTNPLTDADVEAIAAWHANAVRVPLNEDCWLGVHDMPAPGLSVAEYRAAIAGYVASLGAHGLYAILDLHWSNPRGFKDGEGQHPLPDELSVSFWQSVAATFAGDPGVVFDAFNEPYSPADQGDPTQPVTWDCWEGGGCPVPADPDTQSPNPQRNYLGFGMQQMVDAIRAGGATQPIMLGGLDYANDLSQWLSHEPSDPLGQLAASFHNYPGKNCESETCWNDVIATVAASVPVVTGEFDEFDCGSAAPDSFDNRWMNWADGHGVSYLAWGWIIPDAPDCGENADYLITDYSGTPSETNGIAVHDHLAALAAPPSPAGPPAPGPSSSGAPSSSPPPAPGGGSKQPPAAADRTAIVKALALDLRHLGKVPTGDKVAAGKWRPKLDAPGAGSLSLRLLTRGGGRPKPLARGLHAFATAGSASVPVAASKAGRRFLLAHPKGSVTVSLAFDPGPGEPVVKALGLRLGSGR